MSKLTHEGLRIMAVGLSVAIPLIGTWAASGVATNAALATLQDSAVEEAKRTGMSLAEVAAGTTQGDIINGIFVGYLLLGAVVAGVGAIMRAVVHGWKGKAPESVDFSGKCLAIAGQTIVVLAAYVRFAPGAGSYTPAWAFLVAGVVVGIGAIGLARLGRRIAETTPPPTA